MKQPIVQQPITRMNPPALPDAGRPGYSQISVVEPGRMAYVSGQGVAALAAPDLQVELELTVRLPN